VDGSTACEWRGGEGRNRGKEKEGAGVVKKGIPREIRSSRLRRREGDFENTLKHELVVFVGAVPERPDQGIYELREVVEVPPVNQKELKERAP
jgi:hypothetical protein